VGFGAGVDGLDYDDLLRNRSQQALFDWELRPRDKWDPIIETARSQFTFLPAYLPRVMIATRPTLRTVEDQVSTVAR
jgi:hypothetical protein